MSLGRCGGDCFVVVVVVVDVVAASMEDNT
ncbi:hypothetical protein A2U01_0114456, partial [Trifolium medium]|nr:hypothetical protein [Trifolium medium]